MQDYNNTDQQLHWLCQIIAKANRTFVPKKEDDSHTNLYFDSIGNRIWGRWIDIGHKRLIFTLNLDNLHIEILDSSRKLLGAVDPISKIRSEVEEKILQLLPALGLSINGFTDELHFEIPDNGFAGKPMQHIEENKLAEWKNYRQLANRACYLLLGHAQAASEVRIWPHHFDTGFYSAINRNVGLGFGLAMKDDMVDAPYFYMSGYNNSGSIEYSDMPECKNWRWELRENWKGVILPLTRLRDESEGQRLEILKEYVSDNIEWFVGR